MENDYLETNLDWDPSYLAQIFNVDFNDMSDLWGESDSSVDTLLLQEMDKYCPVVEDITIEDEVLCAAVESIENE